MSQKGSNKAGLISVAAITAATLAGFMVACNPNPVEYLSSAGQIVNSKPTSISGQTEMDILWVIDNSFSMCQEQQVLRDNFNQFVEELEKTSLDFHISVTTTHYPEPASSAGRYDEPVAVAGQIQSRPQPLPGPNSDCREGTGSYDPNLNDGTDESVMTNYLPIQQSLAVARSCLAENLDAAQYTWTDGQIACALSGNMPTGGCTAANNITDRNGDTFFTAKDLYPDPQTGYRPIPKVLRSVDYTGATGLDTERLRQDFNCMASVGTSGAGIEKGLRAAVNAVSRDKTGGAVGIEGANDAAANHGFIRQDAGFTLVFVTDENDCSHDGKIDEVGGTETCQLKSICEYENSQQVSDQASRLTTPEALAEELRANLAATKGVDAVEDEDIIMAGIYGTWKRYEEPYPDCAAGNNPAVQPTCTTGLGSADSGDRYERFIRQFSRFFPNTGINEDNRLDFSATIGIGEMCKPAGFGGALRAIGQFIQPTGGSCIRERVLPCEEDSECPNLVGTDVPGKCIAAGPTTKFCTSGVTLKLVAKNADTQFQGDAQAYCQPGTEGFFDNEANANCVVNYDQYKLEACPSGAGIQFSWIATTTDVTRILDGKYNLETIYSIDPNPAPSDEEMQ